jgi:hypothetical protein
VIAGDGTSSFVSSGMETFMICLPLRVLATMSASLTTKPLPAVETIICLRCGSWTKAVRTS